MNEAAIAKALRTRWVLCATSLLLGAQTLIVALVGATLADC